MSNSRIEQQTTRSPRPRGQSSGQRVPYGAGPATAREPKAIIRAPRNIVATKADVFTNASEVGDRHAVSNPLAVHELRIPCPYLLVVRTHEDVRDSGAERLDNPLTEVPRLRARRRDLCGLFESAEADIPVGVGKAMQIQLEGVWDKAPAHPDPRFAIVVQPPVHAEQIVHQLIEHLVVAELHVPAQIPRESVLVDDGLRKAACNRACFENEPIGDPALLEPPRGAEARRTSTNDQVSYFHCT